jgi:hypothetical protein
MNTDLSYSNAGTARNRNNNLANLENLMKIMVQDNKILYLCKKIKNIAIWNIQR